MVMPFNCPYCRIALERDPHRKTKCPNCKEHIYVRSTQRILPSIFLTKDDALAVDEFKNLENFGIEITDYQSKKDELKKRFGMEPKSTDIIWGLYNELIYKANNDHQLLQRIYRSMAYFLHMEGKDSYKILKLANQNELMIHMEIGIEEKVRISTLGPGASCEECLRLEGRIYTIREALEKMPLPWEHCTFEKSNKNHGFCRCIYLLVSPLDYL